MRKFYTTGILAASLFMLTSYGQISAQQKQPTQTPRTLAVYESQFKGDLHTIKFIPHLSVNETCLDQRLDEYVRGIAVYALLFDKNRMLSTLVIKSKDIGQKNEEKIRALARGCGTTIMPNNNLKKKNAR